MQVFFSFTISLNISKKHYLFFMHILCVKCEIDLKKYELRSLHLFNNNRFLKAAIMDVQFRSINMRSFQLIKKLH